MTDNYAMASYYRMTAVVYWESAKVLYEDLAAKSQPAPGNRMAIPFYFLVSQAVELLLKCALLKRNTSLVELKKYPLRHSLSSLLQGLRDKGVPISALSISLVDTLSHQHEKHMLRYTVFVDDGEPTFTPEPSELFLLLEELLMAGRIATHGV